jgi:hypothetical protein
MTHPGGEGGGHVTEHDEELLAAREAMRCRLSVLANLDRPDRGKRLALELMDVPEMLANPNHLLNAELIRQQLLAMLGQAETFIAPPEMCGMLNAVKEDGTSVAMSYPGETLRVRDIISPNGMIYFTDPIADPTGQHDLHPIRAMSWSVATGDDPAIRFLDPPPGAMMLTLIGYCDTRILPSRIHLDKPMGPLELQENPRIYPVSPVVWQVGVKGGGLFWEEEGEEVQAQARTLRLPYIKTLLAWWAIMRQRLTEMHEPVVRSHPKELQRALRRRPTLNTDLHVIRLRPRRRYKYTEHGGANYNKIDWRSAWTVRSHWREDWRARQRGEEDQYTLVPSHVKGPWDKEVRGVERAFLPPLPPKPER